MINFSQKNGGSKRSINLGKSMKSMKSMKSQKSVLSIDSASSVMTHLSQKKLEPGFYEHDQYQTVLAYLKTSLIVESSTEMKDMIHAYIIKPRPRKTFKRNRANGNDKRNSPIQ